jgi:hypothetical protein
MTLFMLLAFLVLVAGIVVLIYRKVEKSDDGISIRSAEDEDQALMSRVDVVDSRESLQEFMLAEGIARADRPQELIPYHDLIRYTNGFAREILEGSRSLNIDLFKIPVDGLPNRKTAIRIYTRLENRMREYRGQAFNVPFFPYDSNVLLGYTLHDEHWEPKIESELEATLQRWDRYPYPPIEYGDTVVMEILLLSETFFNSPYKAVPIDELSQRVVRSMEDRCEVASLMYRSYKEMIMIRPDYSFYHEYDRYEYTIMGWLVQWVDQLTSMNAIQFDRLYHLGVQKRRQKRRY